MLHSYRDPFGSSLGLEKAVVHLLLLLEEEQSAKSRADLPDGKLRPSLHDERAQWRYLPELVQVSVLK